MKTKFFNAVRKGAIGDGTVGALVDWIERLINVLFPENGIEYWSDNRYAGPQALKRYQAIPVRECKDDSVRHVACYAREGSCEGMIIECAVYLRNDSYLSLTWAKTFGGPDETWQIARAVSEVLESIFSWGDIPEIVDMADKVPRQYSWLRETSLKEKVVLATTENTLSVKTLSGIVLDERDFSNEGVNAKFHVEPLAKDWETVLRNMKVDLVLSTGTDHQEPDLPGYIFTQRGLPDITGYYILLPDGNPNDDRDYLAYCDTLDKAIATARVHRDIPDRTHLLHSYRVVLENDVCEVVFDCEAETSGHAAEQAKDAYPGATVSRYHRDGSLPLKLAA